MIAAPAPWLSHTRRELTRILLVGCALLCVCTSKLSAEPDSPSEYALKAVFLFNFAQFVDWPTDSSSTSKTPLVIGVLGDDPFGSLLDETVRDETVNERPLIVRRFKTVDEVDSCQILFISKSEASHVEEIVASLRGRSILTVGDNEGFAQLGVMIRFVTEKKKIKLKINVNAAKAANITISSKLLRLAEIVTSEKS